MIRLNVLVEGPTEEVCVRDVLAPHLAEHQVLAVARSVETSRVRTRYTPRGARAGRIFRGGMRTYTKARDDLRRWMKEDNHPDCYFTTMFDLYGLPNDFPGRRGAQRARDPYRKVALLEDAFRQDIDHHRFIPYLQLHEFEALILADPQKLDWAFIEHEEAIQRLVGMCEQYESPELIDDGIDTAPSKRIIREIPEYEGAKPTSGPMIVGKIGVPVLRARCPHFGAWLEKLEALGRQSAP